MTAKQEHWFTFMGWAILQSVTDGLLSLGYFILAMIFFVLWFVEEWE